MTVRSIGLGSQGGPMARRIVEGGNETTLWTRRPATVEVFAGTAAKIAGAPAELAAASDLVFLCVVGDADVDEITTMRCSPARSGCSRRQCGWVSDSALRRRRCCPRWRTAGRPTAS